MEIRIGTSGWNYLHWRGVFYPPKLPKSKWLAYYAEYFDTVEINATFYGPLQKATLERWVEETPEAFRFAVKASRFITHIKRLRGVEEALKRFMDSISPLSSKLAVILFQFPPSLKYDPLLIEDFLSLLPRDIPITIEIRHRSFHDERFGEQLRKQGVALCISDTAGRYPSLLEVITADFAYLRLHGSRCLYRSCYTEEELALWAEKIRSFPVKKVYIYFDNDSLGWAPENALRLKRRLGLSAKPLPEEVRQELSRRPLE